MQYSEWFFTLHLKNTQRHYLHSKISITDNFIKIYISKIFFIRVWNLSKVMFRTPPRRERNGLILLSSFYFLRQSRYHSGNTCNCQHSSCICFVSGLNRHSFLRDFAVIVLIYGIFLLNTCRIFSVSFLDSSSAFAWAAASCAFCSARYLS